MHCWRQFLLLDVGGEVGVGGEEECTVLVC